MRFKTNIFYVWIFVQNFVGDMEKIRRNTVVLQGDSPQCGEMSQIDRRDGFPLGILTQSTAKFAEKTCGKRY